jgi:hypothetical protein
LQGKTDFIKSRFSASHAYLCAKEVYEDAKSETVTGMRVLVRRSA